LFALKLAMVDSRFDRFVDRKVRDAASASIHPLITLEEGRLAQQLPTIGTRWTNRLYGGKFHVFEPPADVPSISLVFVRSRDGDTVIANPSDLGGGPTDLHVIYEGLSRVAADAVLAGASSAAGRETFFSVWHPELVALRQALGLPRHPAQIVVSADGHVDVEGGLLFNVPDVPVFVLAGAQCRDRCAARFATRDWITVVPLEPGGLDAAIRRLRREFGIRRISAIGGRSTATSLIDAGLVQDVCLTTTARSGGQPNTPFYAGACPPRFDLIVRKAGTDPTYPIVVEHLARPDRDGREPSSIRALVPRRLDHMERPTSALHLTRVTLAV
jgi:riboflavin biosynthesis pyrimidine reductase